MRDYVHGERISEHLQSLGFADAESVVIRDGLEPFSFDRGKGAEMLIICHKDAARSGQGRGLSIDSKNSPVLTLGSDMADPLGFVEPPIFPGPFGQMFGLCLFPGYNLNSSR